jgi:hypothetical protein
MIDYKKGICEDMKLFIFEWIIKHPAEGKGIKYVRNLNKEELIKACLFIEGKITKEVLMTKMLAMLRTLRTLRMLRTLRTLRMLRTLRTLRMLRTLRTLRMLRTLRTLRTLLAIPKNNLKLIAFP